MIGLVLQMLFALLLVIGAIYAVGAMAKRRQPAGGLLKVVAYLPLGQRKGVAAVEVAGETLLLGVTANDIRLLKSLDGPLAPPAAAAGTGTPATGGARKVLERIKERFHAAQ